MVNVGEYTIHGYYMDYMGYFICFMFLLFYFCQGGFFECKNCLYSTAYLNIYIKQVISSDVILPCLGERVPGRNQLHTHPPNK